MVLKKKILVVDDAVDLVEELLLRFEASGWEVLTAYDGEEGLKKAQKELPDLILLDLALPKMNGYQVCRELKADSKTKAIPIVVLTASALKRDLDLVKEYGVAVFLTKPCEFAVLVQTITSLI